MELMMWCLKGRQTVKIISHSCEGVREKKKINFNDLLPQLFAAVLFQVIQLLLYQKSDETLYSFQFRVKLSAVESSGLKA
ncbi:CLUMA_CG018398, isoform A [Clunio marinus]|uniref:CLUMA_CG018398, isoform A n=1 Tax=Clunio marinus TaxID=568069 RepID=A0A1J1J0H4_9DIPT|nr:CLUMA_CG018398, isoform A [Clunio marinus]